LKRSGQLEQVASHFVALSPTRILDDDLLSRVAEVLGKDAYNARLLLAGEMPHVVAQYHSEDLAIALADKLKALGLAAIAGSIIDLRQVASATFMAHSLQNVDQDVIFRAINGETIRISGDDIFLMLEGILPSIAQRKEGQTEKKLNLPATLALGGIPVWRKSQTRTGPAEDSESFLRLYRSTSSQAVVEIRSRGFDYSFLAAKKGFSSEHNFKTATGALQGFFPEAIYDSRLARNSPVEFFNSTPQATTEGNLRLMYLFYTDPAANRPH
jgi:hypothetical protein